MNSNITKLRTMTGRNVKRFRSAFTTEQINFLEQQFQKFPYIDSEHRKELAVTLNMQERAVKIWFQNRRMKEKKETAIKDIDDQANKGQDISKHFNITILPNSNVSTVNTSNEICSHPIQSLATNERLEAKIKTDKNNLFKESHRKIISKPYEVPKAKGNVNTNFINTYKEEKIGDKMEKEANLKADIPVVSYFFDPTTKSAENICKENKNNFKTEPKIPILNNFIHNSKHNKTSLRGNTRPERVNRPEGLEKPSYVPIMPTIYAQPIATPGGVLWKPMNVMPVIGSLPIQSNQQENIQNKRINCTCNCHSKTQIPVGYEQVNPYSQYVVSVPF